MSIESECKDMLPHLWQQCNHRKSKCRVTHFISIVQQLELFVTKQSLRLRLQSLRLSIKLDLTQKWPNDNLFGKIPQLRKQLP